MYIDFICPKNTVVSAEDPLVSTFDAWENYDILCDFYDSCPECQSFPKEEYFAEGSQEKWTDYVIYEDGVIAARAGIWRCDDEQWEVAGVITRPEYRGRGYAQRLVRHCIGVIHANGRDAILTTHESNKAMINAAIKAGFVVQQA